MADDTDASSRLRRPKKSDSRQALFEKLRSKNRRGEKNTYECGAYESLFEEIDEDEYETRVRQRQEDAFVVDDDGSGYFDHGRDICDDDNNEDDGGSTQQGKEKSSKTKASKKPPRNSIKNYTLTATKKAEDKITLDGDQELLNILNAIGSKEPEPAKSTILKQPRSHGGASAVTKSTIKTEKPINPFSISMKRDLSSPIKQRPDKLLRQGATPPKANTFKAKDDVHDSEESLASLIIDDAWDDQSQKDNIADIDQFVSQQPHQETPSDSAAISEYASQKSSIGCIKNEIMETELESLCNDINIFADDDPANYTEVKPSVKTERTSTSRISSASAIDDSAEASMRANNVEIESAVFDSLLTSNDEYSVLKMYCLDVYEDFLKHPGNVYLFGKVKVKNTFASCCINVHGVERRIFVLPREKRIIGSPMVETDEYVTFEAVYEELVELLTKRNIMNIRIKKRPMKYCLTEVGVPTNADYLELRYSFSLPELPADFCGQTFSHIFGTGSTGLELLLVEQRLRLPRWIEIKNPVVSTAPFSWCNFEATVDKPSYVQSVTDCSCPPLRVMSLAVRTSPGAKVSQKEIVAVGISSQLRYDFENNNVAKLPWQRSCVMTKPNGCTFPYDFTLKIGRQRETTVETVANERALLSFLLAKIQKVDPDVIVGHGLWDFELHTLVARIIELKIPSWSRISRLRRAVTHRIPTSKHALHDAIAGRLACDLKVMAMEFLRAKSYDLSELVRRTFSSERIDVPEEMVRESFNDTASLMKFTNAAADDAIYCGQLMSEIRCLPLTSEITRIVGGVWSKTLLGGRAERTEFLLLHAFEEASYIAPEKLKSKKAVVKTEKLDDDNEDNENNMKVETGGRKKAAYIGGLVLEPKKGLYDKFILLLDFNSLYPSIIMEYNVCFTTIKQSKLQDKAADVIPELPPAGLAPGILPNEIKQLVESRKAVKNILKRDNVSDEQKKQLDIRQQALKITANSMYGCLGFSSSRFHAKPLAALITLRGREILMDTKEMVERMGLDVIYGDTDSIMINSNCLDYKQALTLGKKVTQDVNKKYRLLELDIDGVYKKLLLLKKKKYAGLMVKSVTEDNMECVLETKGLDIVRRDWSVIAIEAGKDVLAQIMSDSLTEETLDEIHSYLTQLSERLRNGAEPLEKFLISKQLTKAPSEYRDIKSLPHVQVAQRLNEKGRHLKHGDTISYVICKNGTSDAATQRAYDLSEMNDSLAIDIEYYLSQQIHPVVSRLVSSIDGTDAVRIAACLGLDTSQYKSRNNALRNDLSSAENTLFTTASMSVDYSLCDPFTFKCPNKECGHENFITSIFNGVGKDTRVSLSRCSNEQCIAIPLNHHAFLLNWLQLLIRNYITKHYQNWMICEDPVCGYRTRQLFQISLNGKTLCNHCRQSNMQQEYGPAALFSQLSYFESIFDWPAASAKVSPDVKKTFELSGARNIVDQLKNVCSKFVRLNAYSSIDLCRLYREIM